MTDSIEKCPHCDSKLKKWRVPEEASWDEEMFLVCFNDECGYYKRGWTQMSESFGQRGSYRFTVNPVNGAQFMIPVWSATATKEMIMEDDEGGQA